MKIFVLHYSKLTERKASILKQFEQQGITDYEFIETYDKDSLTEQEIDMFIPEYKKSKISLFLKHFHVVRRIQESYDQALVLEDDAILADKFLATLEHYMTQVPSTYDMVFLGNGWGLHIPLDTQTPGRNIYERGVHPTKWGGNGATRCTDSILISKQCAIKLCKYFDMMKSTDYKIKDRNIDWFYNRAARDTNLHVYWAEPTIVSQGSEQGLFPVSY
jgi:GR25 family glycosyltransferase involved in LPS biosynthesis